MGSSSTARPPPFCPRPTCESRKNPGHWRYKKKGFFFRSQKPCRVQRYVCHHCGRNFSSQTFETSYWLRRPDLLAPVFQRLLACSALRQIARELEVSHSTIQRLGERLGRHCLLFHETLRPRKAPREPLVLDGFRTFEHSQYWPMDLNLLVGVSHFVYGFNDAELRRSGTMRPSQKAKRQILETLHGRPDPQATRRQVEELLRRIVPPRAKALIRSDEHPAYPQAMRRLTDRTFQHETISSRVSRTTRNPL
ncbi:MAG: transposase, partial [bacterium]